MTAKMTKRRPRRRAAGILLDHVVLEVADPAASAEFYRAILRLAPVRLREYLKEEAPFVSARINETSVIDFMPPAMWRGKRAVNPNHFCLTFASRRGVHALERRLAAAGIPVAARADKNFGAQGFASSIYFEDPDGVMVEARSYPR